MLKYSLVPMEKAFAFQITEQSDKINKAINYIGGSFYASNGWEIKIDTVPEIKVTSRKIYLRGFKSDSDLRVDRTWNLGSNVQRDEILNQVNSALSEIITFAQSYPYNYRIGPNAYLGVYQPYNYSVVYSAPEVEVAPVVSPEDGWGQNRMKHSKPILYAH